MNIEKIQRIRGDANRLEINPSDQVWLRLEKRLDQPGKKQPSRLLIGLVAASFTLLIGFFLLRGNQDVSSPNIDFLVQDQQLFAPDDVQFIQNSYSLNTWKNIDEGKRGRKLVIGS